jgi:alkylation response protein AidB-like acyl-CoA dehydrogenase
MDFNLPKDLVEYLAQLDAFIERDIAPLPHEGDNNRFFDHRREYARTDWDKGGIPRKEWEELMKECVRRADKAGFYRFHLPAEYGGQQSEGSGGRGSNLWMAVIREHLAAKGLGLFNDLQSEHSIVGNFPDIVMVRHFGTEAQKKEFIQGRLDGKVHITFGLTEPNHGSDATHMITNAVPETRNGVEGWKINGAKKWQTGMHTATHCFIFARTEGKAGSTSGITCFVVPPTTPGFKIESYEWFVSLPINRVW